uniref:TPX2 C-terminal domain-containing protein n=1 Tax=Phaeomonas parva TaxID=124430 RepID=A0A7S1UBK9_9STRA
MPEVPTKQPSITEAYAAFMARREAATGRRPHVYEKKDLHVKALHTPGAAPVASAKKAGARRAVANTRSPPTATRPRNSGSARALRQKMARAATPVGASAARLTVATPAAKMSSTPSNVPAPSPVTTKVAVAAASTTAAPPKKATVSKKKATAASERLQQLSQPRRVRTVEHKATTESKATAPTKASAPMKRKASFKAKRRSPKTRGKSAPATARTKRVAEGSRLLKATTASVHNRRAKHRAGGDAAPAATATKPKLKRSASAGPRGLTVPASPTFMRRDKGRSRSLAPRGPTAEERELAEVQRKKALLERRQRRNEKYYRSKVKGTDTVAVLTRSSAPSTKKLTEPVTPQSVLASRRGSKRYSVAGPAKSPDAFTPTHPARASARRRASMAAEYSQGRPLTAPTAPKFRTESRASQKAREVEHSRKLRGEPASGVGASPPLAEKLAKLNETPSRFHTAPRTRSQPPAVSSERKPRGLTVPHSPKFHKLHASARKALPSEERELEEMRSHQFKARALDTRVLHGGGHLGVPVVEPQKLTTPHDFRFATDNRAHRQPPPKSSEEMELEAMNFNFHAAPVPDYNELSALLSSGAKVQRRGVTVPHAPRLATDARASSRGPLPEPAVDAYVVEHDALVKAAALLREVEAEACKPLPSAEHSKPLGLTTPQEFRLSTDARGEVKQRMLQQRLQEERRAEAEAHYVKALPLPDPNAVFVPRHSAKELTEATGFALASESRHEKAVAKMQATIADEERKARRASVVKARPLPPTNYEPAVPPPPPKKELVTPMNFELNSDKRARDRAQFDAYLEEREFEREEEARHAEDARQREEEAMLWRLRRMSADEGGMQFKARERYNPQPMVPTPSQKTPTVPEAPHFSILKHGTARRVAHRVD